MDTSPAQRRSPLGLFPGEPEPRLYDRVVETLRARHWLDGPVEALNRARDVIRQASTRVQARGRRCLLKPRPLMQVILPFVYLLGIGWFFTSYIIYDDYKLWGLAMRLGTKPIVVRALLAAIFGLFTGTVTGYPTRDEILVLKIPEDTKNFLNRLTARLVSLGMRFESHTEVMYTFKGGFGPLAQRVHVLIEPAGVAVCGPTGLLKKAQDVLHRKI